MARKLTTRHADGTTSLRLRRHGDGTDAPSMEDVLHGLWMAVYGFETNAAKCREGRGMAGDDAASYDRMAAHYRSLLSQLEAEMRNR